MHGWLDELLFTDDMIDVSGSSADVGNNRISMVTDNGLTKDVSGDHVLA